MYKLSPPWTKPTFCTTARCNQPAIIPAIGPKTPDIGASAVPNNPDTAKVKIFPLLPKLASKTPINIGRVLKTVFPFAEKPTTVKSAAKTGPLKA